MILRANLTLIFIFVGGERIYSKENFSSEGNDLILFERERLAYPTCGADDCSKNGELKN